MHQLQPLRRHLLVQTSHAGHVAAWPVEAGHKTRLDRVSAGTKDDWNTRCRRLRRQCRRRAAGNYKYCHLLLDETCRKLRQSTRVRLRPSIFDVDGLALYIACRT